MFDELQLVFRGIMALQFHLEGRVPPTHLTSALYSRLASLLMHEYEILRRKLTA